MSTPCSQDSRAVPDAAWDTVAAWYDSHHATFETTTLSLPTPPLLETFRAQLPASARVLDAGCGAGRDSRALVEAGFTVHALDLSAQMVRATRDVTDGRVRPRQMDLRDYADPAGSWDGIWCLASLLHLPRPQVPAVVAALARSLRPGGVLALSVKHGAGEILDSMGRPVTLFMPGEIGAFLTGADTPHLHVEIDTAQAPSSAGTTRWINALATRPDRS